MFLIKKYKSESGECPVDEFITELIKSGERGEASKISYYIKLLETFGDEILSNSTWAKKLDNKIYELRPKNSRVLYFMCSSKNEYVLLHCFKKKTQKTPQKEIEKAIKEAADYERRINDGK